MHFAVSYCALHPQFHYLRPFSCLSANPLLYHMAQSCICMSRTHCLNSQCLPVDASTMDSVHLLWARTLRDADRVIFLDDGNPDVVSAVRIIQFGSRLPINLEDYQAVQAEIQ